MDQTRLYYQDSYMKTFQCTVESCVPGKKPGTWLAVLDQTAFYPEGGGQPYDTGTLNGVPVLEVHESGGQAVHTLAGPLEPGTQAEGVIDWTRRMDHMQHHTGEHILSGLVHSRFGYDNVGFHMGSQEVTVDFNGPITMEEIDQIEDLANQIVFENVPVQESYPDGEALKRMEYRSKKELEGVVRIVTIPGADVCACCGTHVKYTGEVGMIKVKSMMHYKGGVRLSIVCGRKALLDYRQKTRAAAAISNMLSAKPELIDQAVEKMKKESQEMELKISAMGRKLAQMEAASWPQSQGPLVLFEEDFSPIQLRQLCTLLYEQGKGGIVLTCAPAPKGGFHYVLGSGSQDMRGLSRQLNARLQGKGGGSAQMAQGTFEAQAEQIREIFMEEAGRTLAG